MREKPDFNEMLAVLGKMSLKGEYTDDNELKKPLKIFTPPTDNRQAQQKDII